MVTFLLGCRQFLKTLAKLRSLFELGSTSKRRTDKPKTAYFTKNAKMRSLSKPRKTQNGQLSPETAFLETTTSASRAGATPKTAQHLTVLVPDNSLIP
jgi:hypothetical protein